MVLFKRSPFVEKARAVFFRQWNDIAVFVEDTEAGTRKLYAELLGRLTEGRFKIQDVFPLGGREEVLEVCRNDQEEGGYPSLYLIDGDLDLLLGTDPPALNRLFRLNAYCIENYLIDEAGVLALLDVENPERLRGDLAADVDFDNWLTTTTKLLSELFVIFTLSRKFRPELETVGIGIGPFVTKCGQQKLDETAIAMEIAKRWSDLASGTDSEVLQLEKNTIAERMRSSEYPSDFISGKNFLLPLLRIKLQNVATVKVAKIPFKLRMARHCSLSRLQKLKTVLHNVSNNV